MPREHYRNISVWLGSNIPVIYCCNIAQQLLNYFKLMLLLDDQYMGTLLLGCQLSKNIP